MNWYVEIVDEKSGEVVKRMGPHAERKADKIAGGVLANLDHDRFFVRVRRDNETTEEANDA